MARKSVDAEPSAPASSPKHHDDEHCTDTSLMVKGAAVGVGFAAVIAALSFLVFYTLYGQHTVVTYQTIESHHYEDSWSGWGHKGHLDEAAAIFAVLGFLYYLKQIVATIKMVVTAICLIGWFVLTLCECHKQPCAFCTLRLPFALTPPSPLLFPHPTDMFSSVLFWPMLIAGVVFLAGGPFGYLVVSKKSHGWISRASSHLSFWDSDAPPRASHVTTTRTTSITETEKW